MVSEEGLHAADDEILCQKDCMMQMMKYGVRRRDTCRVMGNFKACSVEDQDSGYGN